VDNVRLNLTNVRAKIILIGHWSDHKKIVTLCIFLLWQNPITYSSRDLYISCDVLCPTKFSGVGFCLTKFKLCPTKIKSDRTNVLSSQIFICSPVLLFTKRWSLLGYVNKMFMVGHIFDRSVGNLKPTIIFIWPYNKVITTNVDRLWVQCR
jgi:hypothetical protein